MIIMIDLKIQANPYQSMTLPTKLRIPTASSKGSACQTPHDHTRPADGWVRINSKSAWCILVFGSQANWATEFNISASVPHSYFFLVELLPASDFSVALRFLPVIGSIFVSKSVIPTWTSLRAFSSLESSQSVQVYMDRSNLLEMITD